MMSNLTTQQQQRSEHVEYRQPTTRCAGLLGIVICLLFSGLPAVAQSVPQLINYQGTLTDSSGEPLLGDPDTHTVKLEFNIYDEAGTLVWGPQTFTAVPLNNGTFNVILGPTDMPGRQIMYAFGDADRFLGIKVNGVAEISPRQQILSTPYALSAEQAQFLKTPNARVYIDEGGKTIFEVMNQTSMTIGSDHKVGIGTTNPQATLDVSGDLKVSGVNHQWRFNRQWNYNLH